MANGWEIVSQDPRSLRMGDTLIDAVKVTYRTGNGVVDSVTVPRTAYNPANVRDLIRKQIASHDAVANLGETARETGQ